MWPCIFWMRFLRKILCIFHETRKTRTTCCCSVQQGKNKKFTLNLFQYKKYSRPKTTKYFYPLNIGGGGIFVHRRGTRTNKKQKLVYLIIMANVFRKRNKQNEKE